MACSSANRPSQDTYLASQEDGKCLNRNANGNWLAGLTSGIGKINALRAIFRTGGVSVARFSFQPQAFE